MSIIRIERTSQPYTMIANCTLQDKTISLDSKGLLTYLLSKPDDWKVMSTVIMKEFGIGKDRFYRIINELEEAGYITAERQSNEKGHRTVEYVVYETPWNVELIAKPWVSKSSSGKSSSGKSSSGQSSSGYQETTKNRLNKEQIYTKEPLDKVSVVTDSMRDAQELTKLLSEKVRANGFKFTDGTNAVEAMERLVRIDGHSYEQIAAVIEWCQKQEFWIPNIRSAQKLRDKYDLLYGQMMRGKRGIQKFLQESDDNEW